MFNVDQAIIEWRRQMTAGGVKNPAVLDELESHVREDVERQMRAGAEAQTAFESAAKRIGPASVLKSEFNKATAAAIIEKLMLAAAVLVVAFGAFLCLATLFLCYGSLAERIIGFVAMSLTIATACAWPALVSRLPAIHAKRKLQAMQVLCLVAGFGLCTFYVQVIVRQFERGDGIVPSVGFFGIFFIALGFALAAGLDRAASKISDRITA